MHVNTHVKAHPTYPLHVHPRILPAPRMSCVYRKSSEEPRIPSPWCQGEYKLWLDETCQVRFFREVCQEHSTGTQPPSHSS